MRWSTRAQHRAYTNITEFLARLPEYVASQERVRRAFLQYSGLNAAEMRTAVTLGIPPLFRVAPVRGSNGAIGNGSYDHDTRLITIDLDVAAEVERQTSLPESQATLLLYATCLHELVHYGRHVKNLPRTVNSNEAGKMFECQAYQGDIGWDGESSRLRQSRSGRYNGTPWQCPLSTLLPGL